MPRFQKANTPKKGPIINIFFYYDFSIISQREKTFNQPFFNSEIIKHERLHRKIAAASLIKTGRPGPELRSAKPGGHSTGNHRQHHRKDL
jgi:hypothetical protein